MQLTWGKLKKLIKELEETNENMDNYPVKLEGCDCVGECNGVSIDRHWSGGPALYFERDI